MKTYVQWKISLVFLFAWHAGASNEINRSQSYAIRSQTLICTSKVFKPYTCRKMLSRAFVGNEDKTTTKLVDVQRCKLKFIATIHKNGRLICTGVIFSKAIILANENCVLKSEMALYSVVTGEADGCQVGQGQERKIRSIKYPFGQRLIIFDDSEYILVSMECCRQRLDSSQAMILAAYVDQPLDFDSCVGNMELGSDAIDGDNFKIVRHEMSDRTYFKTIMASEISATRLRDNSGKMNSSLLSVTKNKANKFSVGSSILLNSKEKVIGILSESLNNKENFLKITDIALSIK